MTERKATCIYCGHRQPWTERELENMPVPPDNDEDAWKALAQNHKPGCEWLTTRAHRLEVQ